MKTIAGTEGSPTFLHYHSGNDWIAARIVIDRSSACMTASIGIPMSNIRELIAGLTEMADAHDAESRQEMAA